MPEGLVVVITPMRRRHLRAVLRIEQQVYPRPWSIGLFMSELGYRGSRTYLVARVGTTVVGYAGSMMAGDDAHITTIAVDPAWHRHKIGTRLMLELAQSASTAAPATSPSRCGGNEAAQGLYRTFGFAPAGIRKNYYVETNEDALVMWATDVDREDYRDRLDRLERALPGPTATERAS